MRYAFSRVTCYPGQKVTTVTSTPVVPGSRMCPGECLGHQFETLVCGHHRLPGGVSAGNPGPAALIPTDSFQRCAAVCFVVLRHPCVCTACAQIFGPNAIVLDSHGPGNGALVLLSIPVGLF